MDSEILVGYRKVGPGRQVMRGDNTAAAMVQMAHGAFNDPASRGAIMEACTGVAGVAPGTALSTAPPFALWNPPASGKNLAITKMFLGYISGTLGAGSVVAGVIPAQMTVPTTGTELVPQSTLLGAPRGVGRAFQGSTFVAAPTILRPVWVMGAFLATTAIQPTEVCDVIDGAIVIPQGAALALQGVAAAGTTPLVILGMAWEELDI